MPKKPPTLAKLSRPRLFKTVVRERLLALLDQKREHPVVWVAAPPGAGKTTLAASYIDEAKATAIWFQIDAGDSDPATFFYYLKQAIEQKGRRKTKPLQLFTPEYLSDIEGFARRFFRDAFQRLPEDALLVFDNYHEIGPQSPLHAGFSAALSEIPPGANILVLSRADPPSSFAQATVNQTIAKVTWDDLKITPDEANDIAEARGITDTSIINELQRQTDGWVAGLTLMLEHSIADGEILGVARPEMLETVSAYFAHVIFERASSEAQKVMLQTALLPRITAELTKAVTGDANSIRHIRSLHRRHLFVSRISGKVGTYQYHAMFHAFLRSHARASLPAEEVRAIQATAAQALEANDDLEGAFAMYAGAQTWKQAERLLIDHARELISQGRWRTLQQWIKAMPKAWVDANPWIRYWLGQSQIWVDAAAARPTMESVYNNFVQQGDEVGQALAAAGVLEAIHSNYDFREFHFIDTWIKRLSERIENGVSFPTLEDELQVYSTLAVSAFARNHPYALVWVGRIKELAHGIIDPNLTISVATTLLSTTGLTCDEDNMKFATQLASPLLESPQLRPSKIGLYLTLEGYAQYTFGHYSYALERFDQADEIATNHGLISILQQTAYLRTLCARRAGLHNLAEESADRYLQLREHRNISGPGSLAFLKAVIAFEKSDYEQAVSYALAVEEEMRPEGHYGTTLLIRVVCANILAGSGAPANAKELLELARRDASGPNTAHHLGTIALNEAWVAHLQSDDSDRDTYLHEALEWAHSRRGRVRFDWYRNALSDLLPIALERNIEPDIASQLARELNIMPRDTTSEQWPWPVKVYTLGDFRLLIDNQPPSYSRKKPKKPLALLKAIIALGGKSIPEQKLIDALWPDTEGDAAQRSLRSTVHRLRKLLGHPDAVRQSGGELSLDDRLCWIDAVAFERQITGNGDPGTLERALKSYRGVFLGDDDGSPWLAPYREHLRSKFTDAIGKLGHSLEGDGRDKEAIALYSRGIEADNLVESFYQGVMRCHERLGQRTEAINIYRRLRDILSITLGIEPSPRSRQMIVALRQS